MTLRPFAMPVRPLVSFRTTLSLTPRSLAGRSRFAEADAVLASGRGFIDHCGHVKQRLRRNAPDVQAHAAKRRVTLDEDDFLAQIRRAECRRVAARTGAEDDDVALVVGLAPLRSPRLGRDPRRPRLEVRGVSPGVARGLVDIVRIRLPSATLSPTLTDHAADPPTGAGISIVALSDSTVISGSFWTVSPGFTSISMTGRP